MESLQIKFKPSFKEKLMHFLNSCDSNEIEIVWEDLNFEKNKKILNDRLLELRAGKSKLISIDDYEASLDKMD